MSTSNEEFDFTTRAPQQIATGTIFGRNKTSPVSPENPQVRYIATRGVGGGRTVGYFELNDGVNPPARITDEAARSVIQTNRLGSLNTSTNVLPTLPPNQESDRRSTAGAGTGAAAGAQGSSSAPLPKAVIEDRLRGEGVNTNTELFERDSEGNLTNIPKASTVDSAFSTGERTAGTFNIGRFRAEVSGADSVLPTHSFLVVFAPMIWTRSKFSAQNLDSLLTMRCDNVVLPSVNLLQEQNIRRYGFGPVENVAYGLNVGDFTLQFIVDKSALVVEYFEEWLNLIVNRDSFGGANMNNDTNGRKPYEIAYKDTYACPNVNVFVYDRAQNQVMTYNIYDVFPTGIQSMNMSWSEENTLMKLNITFSFTDLRINRIPPKTRVDDTSFKDDIIVTARRNRDGTFAAGGAGDPLSTLNLFGGRTLELTDLSNETTIIGNFPGRIRGSVPPIPESGAASTIAPEVTPPTTRLPSGVPFTVAP
jgi:hypothetical protein